VVCRRGAAAGRGEGLTIEQLDLRTIDRATAEEHYGEHREKPFFGELVDFITSGPVVDARITGPVVAGSRSGATSSGGAETRSLSHPSARPRPR
jgi:nucleoside diphosphate kinase